MIKIGDKIINQEQFGDGTLKCPVFDANSWINGLDKKLLVLDITWCYDNDSELFALWCLVNDLRQQNPHIILNLYLPYIPHARQDRNVSGRLFTLKYFANLINQMNFEHVSVLDPHSDVSIALIDRVRLINYDVESYIQTRKDLFKNILITNVYFDPPQNKQVVNKSWQYMYPDNGAAKKYGADTDAIIGIKHRNEEGRIDHYEISGLKDTTSTVIIKDDICSYGGTFVEAAKQLREKGVKYIILAVSHCEDNILKGEVFNYIDEVWTTDSICKVSHPKLKIVKRFRDDKLI